MNQKKITLSRLKNETIPFNSASMYVSSGLVLTAGGPCITSIVAYGVVKAVEFGVYLGS